MSAFIFLTVVALLWVAREILVGLNSIRMRKKYEYLRRLEQTQGRFAVVRNELMRFAVEGEADAKSATFREIYQLNTAFMRRPDEYKEMSAALRRFVMSSEMPSGGSAISREMSHIDPGTKEAARMTSEALSHIVVDYSFVLRSAYDHIRKSDPSFTKHRLVSDLAKDMRKPKVQKRKFEQDVSLAQNRLRQMAMA